MGCGSGGDAAGSIAVFRGVSEAGGLFDAWVADSPLRYTSPNAPNKRDVLGTALLGVLGGCRRYAHLTALRCDAVNPPLLGMTKMVSQVAVHRKLGSIASACGEQ